MTTVFFATNRVVSGDATSPDSYTAHLQPAGTAQDMVYGSAFVDGTDLASNSVGTITRICDTALGQFPDSARGDLGDGGRNLLVFIHGFDNTFSNAITRAAFNREWMAAAGTPGTDATVMAFSWPSSGRILGFPVLDSAYKADQNMARQSGYHLMTFLANLEPILTQARKRGHRTILLAHSMGNLALQGAVEGWLKDGNGRARLFDCAALAAADCAYDTFAQADLARLSGLPQLVGRTSIYFSHGDLVLDISKIVNAGMQRLGQDGPENRSDTTLFPPDVFTMVDASGFDDYDRTPLATHQYYRLSKDCRNFLAEDMSGKGEEV